MVVNCFFNLTNRGMDKISKLINEAHTVNISLEVSYYNELIGYFKEAEVSDNENKLFQKRKTYHIETSSESIIRTFYNDARFSLALLSHEQLANALQVLQSYSYKKFYLDIKAFTSKFNSDETNEIHEISFIYSMRKHLICDIPNKGRITHPFLCGLTSELSMKNRYMDALADDIKKLLGEEKNNEEKKALNAPFAPLSVQESIHSNLDLSLENSDKPINAKTNDIDFYNILDNALNYINDFIEMREHFKREYKHAKITYHNNKESFYKALLSVVISEGEKCKHAIEISEENAKRCISQPYLQYPELRYNLAEIDRFIYNINVVRFEDTLTQIKERAIFKNSTTIPEKVKALFYFLEFLHVNMANFKEYNSVLEEREELFLIKEGIKKSNDGIRKSELPLYEASIQSKSEALLINVVNPIKVITEHLNICNWSSSKRTMLLSIADIEELQKSYSSYDIAIVHEYEKKYFEYRGTITSDYICFEFLVDLEKIVFSLFSFFKDKEIDDEQVVSELGSEDKLPQAEKSSVHKVEENTVSQSFTLRKFDLQSLTEALNPKTGGHYLNNIKVENEFSYENKESETKKGAQLLAPNIEVRNEEDLNHNDTKEEKSDNHVLESTGFSVSQWATVFYYVYKKENLAERKITNATLNLFMNTHNIKSGFNNLYNAYYKVRKEINTDHTYPIYKLEEIVPFIEKHYKDKTTDLLRDILLLKNENDE